MWWNVWDLARQLILDAQVLDRNVTWLTKHKDTLDASTRCEDTWLLLYVTDANKASWQANDRRRVWKTVVIEEDQDSDPWSSN